MEAKATLMRRENELRNEQMASDIELEEQRKAFVAGQAHNSRTLAEAEAHRVAAVMQALEKFDEIFAVLKDDDAAKVEQLIAQAFGGIAERAERIGQLNVSPELLQGLMAAGAGAKAAS
jgi:Mg2+/Co2+ transporter CorC